MTLVISKVYTYDADVSAYITAVEAADAANGQSGGLEAATCRAINQFIVGLKVDGLWPAVKASCILSGARTLAGALVPLAGTAPTNFNFVAGDYNRKTGLAGDGSTKYLLSNRNNNADPQDSFHLSVYATTAVTNNLGVLIGCGGNSSGSSNIFANGTRCRSNPSDNQTVGSRTGILAVNRSSASAYIYRSLGANVTISSVSQAPFNGIIGVYRTPHDSFLQYANARLAFYSIGESLDLAKLDTRVTDLINAFAAAIP